MKLLFAVTMAALVTMACADVSHLGSYNYPAPTSTDLVGFAPKQTYTQSHVGPQIESIKSSIPLSSFTIRENGQNFGSQSYSGGQSSGAYNGPIQQHFTATVHQQSYTGPSTASVPHTYSGPAAGHGQNSYLPPGPQQQYQSTAPLLSAPAPVEQSFNSPAVSLVQNSYLPPASASVLHYANQQSYSAPDATPVIQQSFSAHAPNPVQQTYTAPAVAQQQSYSSGGQIQEQSFELSGHQQPLLNGIESTSLLGTGAYNYQAPTQQQSVPASAPVSIQQSYPAPAAALFQQSFSAPANVQHQSISTSSNVEGGSLTYQPSVSVEQSYTSRAASPVQQSFSAPGIGEVQQTVTGSSGLESSSYNYQPQQFSVPVQQTLSVPAVTPVQLAGSSGAVGIDTGSYNYQTPGSVKTAAPLSISQGVEYSVAAPQKIALPTPVSELTAPAPAPTPEVGTVYGTNGGYVYRKF